ncbi:MAG: hypothetical protein HYU77_15980 [Betaproteobacteria bacterium]|nr:hypothetical protein [Betaproteobacteria bacterium]
METRLSLTPGQNGTKNLVRQYGDRLVCVRYRYDAQRGKRYKTVELIVEETNWQPRAGASVRAADHMVGVRIGYGEAELREKVKQAGGIWRPKQKLWELRYDQARALGLAGRIVSG